MAAGLQVTNTEEGTYIVGKEKYINGFLIKAVSIKSLITENIKPTLDEIERFKNSESSDYSRGSKLMDIIDTKDEGPIFAKGDYVRAVSGDLKGIMGTVLAVQDNTVTVEGKGRNNSDQVSEFNIPNFQLEKFFKVGDHCKIIGGKYDGETGLITKLKENVVFVFSDLTQQEVPVLKQHIRLCAEVSLGKLSLGNYELHDLVMLNSAVVGIITKVERDSFHLLDHLGVHHKVRLLELGNKINTKLNAGLDKYQNKLGIEDLVTILEGSGKGKQGQIRHVYRSVAFVLCKDIKENSGVVVVSTKFLSLSGAPAKKGSPSPASGSHGRSDNWGGPPQSPSSFNKDSFGFNDPFSGGRGRGRGRGDGSSPRPRGRGPPLRHKMVTVTTGTFKGHFGLVIEETERLVRVELTSKNKTINIDRSAIVLKEDSSFSSYPSSSDGWVKSTSFDRPLGRGAGGPNGGSRFNNNNNNDSNNSRNNNNNFLNQKRPNDDDNSWGSAPSTPNRGFSTPHRNSSSSSWGMSTPSRTPHHSDDWDTPAASSGSGRNNNNNSNNSGWQTPSRSRASETPRPYDQPDVDDWDSTPSSSSSRGNTNNTQTRRSSSSNFDDDWQSNPPPQKLNQRSW